VFLCTMSVNLVLSPGRACDTGKQAEEQRGGVHALWPSGGHGWVWVLLAASWTRPDHVTPGFGW
jgi:hypothetical protein